MLNFFFGGIPDFHRLDLVQNLAMRHKASGLIAQSIGSAVSLKRMKIPQLYN